MTQHPTDKEPVLQMSGLTFSYPGRQPVLDNINLKIYPGQKVGLIGPNGAGKTTLFMLSCGVVKPTAGQVFLYGQPIKTGSFRPELGMIFQNQDDQLFCPSVQDDIGFGPTNMGLSPQEVASRVQQAVETLGIQKLTPRPPHQLSGGEKRLVALAGVLAMHPKLIFYDEPTSNLDLRYRRRLINILKNSQQEAMLVASHDLEFILEVCNRVILLNNGTIIADSNPQKIMGDEELMLQHGLEKPHSLIPHTQKHH